MKTYTKKRLFVRNIDTASLGILKPTITGVLADGLLFSVPAGYTIEYFVFNETAGGTVTVKVGTVAGGDSIIWNQLIGASAPTTVTVDYTHSITASQNIFIAHTGAGWGTAVLDIYIVLQKVN